MDHRLLFSLAIQAIFVLATGFIKSLVKGQLTWARFYLGLEVALAALGNGFSNMVDIVREWSIKSGSATDDAIKDRIVYTVGYVVVAAAVLLLVMLIHQRWEREERFGPDLSKDGSGDYGWAW